MTEICLRISKGSTGVEKRLFKVYRLWVLYHYRGKNCGWTKKYRRRHREAAEGMRELFWRIVNKHYPGYNSVETFALGSKRWMDLESNKSNILFLLVLKGGDDANV